MFSRVFEEKRVEPSTEDMWRKKALLWRDIQERKKSLEAEEKECREALVKLAGDKSKKGSGVKVTKYKLTGRVQYEKIPELEHVDLDQYRAPAKDAWRISLEKTNS